MNIHGSFFRLAFSDPDAQRGPPQGVFASCGQGGCYAGASYVRLASRSNNKSDGRGDIDDGSPEYPGSKKVLLQKCLELFHGHATETNQLS